MSTETLALTADAHRSTSKVVLAILSGVALTITATACGSGEESKSVFDLQTDCFNRNLFYDVAGVCYYDAELTLRAAEGATGVAPTTVAGAARPTPPVRSATPAPTQPAGTGAPVAPTETVPPDTGPSVDPPITINDGLPTEWVLFLLDGPAPAGYDGVGVSLTFAVNESQVFGEGFDPNLEQSSLTTGGFADSGAVALNVVMTAGGGIVRASIDLGGFLANDDSFMEGEYVFTDEFGNVTTGNYQLIQN